MYNGGGAYGHCGMYSPPPPLGDEFGPSEGCGYYDGRYGGDPAQGYRGGMGMGHAAYGGAGAGAGLGWAVFCPRRPATAADSNSSVPSAPYGGG